jgi:transcription elongation GreA/GreB family factor
MISEEASDPDKGIVNYKMPIAEALLDAEEGDEVEILVGSYLRPARLERIVSAETASGKVGH